jgi:lipopolysaccharide exporter
VSVGLRAFSGVLWTIATSIGSRMLGVIGTLILTRFIAPDAYGDVAVAAAVILTANQFSTLGVGQYVIAHPSSGRDATFHAVASHVALGAVVFGAAVLWRHQLAPLVGAPGMASLVPGLALAALVDRVSYIPERVLLRDLHFRLVAVARMLGHVAYTVVSVVFAVAGWGAAAIVMGNLARSLARLAMIAGGADRREWLTPSTLRLGRLREILAFGLPISIGALAAFAARRWDTLLVSRFFGPGPAGTYNLAYNLAEIPAVHVGEHVGEVLLPSFAQMEPARRPEVLARSLRLLGLVMFPLGLGLGAVAPTLALAVLDPAWQSVGPMLTVLAVLSIAAPIGTLVGSYLLARQRPRALMALEGFKLLAILLLIATVGRLSPLWVCVAVDAGFAAHALVSVWFVARVESIPVWALVRELARPLAACIPMLATVAGVRAGGDALGWTSPVLLLVCETLTGGIVYVAAALLVARESVGDLAGLARRSLFRAS